MERHLVVESCRQQVDLDLMEEEQIHLGSPLVVEQLHLQLERKMELLVLRLEEQRQLERRNLVVPS